MNKYQKNELIIHKNSRNVIIITNISINETRKSYTSIKYYILDSHFFFTFFF